MLVITPSRPYTLEDGAVVVADIGEVRVQVLYRDPLRARWRPLGRRPCDFRLHLGGQDTSGVALRGGSGIGVDGDLTASAFIGRTNRDLDLESGLAALQHQGSLKHQLVDDRSTDLTASGKDQLDQGGARHDSAFRDRMLG